MKAFLASVEKGFLLNEKEIMIMKHQLRSSMSTEGAVWQEQELYGLLTV